MRGILKVLFESVIAIDLIWLDVNLLCFYFEYMSRTLFLTVEVDFV